VRYRTKRLGEARVIAEQEINVERKIAEEGLVAKGVEQEKEREALGDQEILVQEDIQKINAQYDENKERVMDMLLTSVMNVRTEIPQVVKQVIEQKRRERENEDAEPMF